ncbi:hypothetical protein ACWEN6_01705 [Sphaerisporangium sp. NPDC004334]
MTAIARAVAMEPSTAGDAAGSPAARLGAGEIIGCTGAVVVSRPC